MREAPFVGSIPIFIGDDLFDEAAFEAARAWGGGGVLVGAPRQTAARGRLQDPNEVCTWIDRSLMRGSSDFNEVAWDA